MASRAMIVVGGGSSTRFGTDKLLADIDGLPLIAYTIDAVAAHVDRCVVVCRREVIDDVQALRPDVAVTAGGETRTLSEMAGLAAVGGGYDLVGIHDAARPVLDTSLIDRLFSLADQFGGALPVLAPERIVLDRKTHQPVSDVRLAQTPQVFRSADLMAAYVRAAQAGYEGQDTVQVVHHFTDVTIVTVAGHASNVKVTYPEDIDRVAGLLTGRSRT